ncbi:hypothetical protein [Roseofilum casamattae]|uniref:Uncharacterized protein n=1 Tax=Roseofilum casamattae BLCC-M143 TaxID=3022442 RepID=A0ABT7BWU4_9CYAN|nr:hypothetical protein [Roseofilum casamattae]MDJ1183669.1 hypothetical protein [Roseofilum casamattae BLCC-M143]
MLSIQEKLSDQISEIFATVGATGLLSSADYQTVQRYFENPELEHQDRCAVTRLLRAVKRGRIRIVTDAIAS